MNSPTTTASMATAPVNPPATNSRLVNADEAESVGLDLWTGMAWSLSPRTLTTMHGKKIPVIPLRGIPEALGRYGNSIFTGHPAMTELQFDPGQVGDIIAHSKFLGR